MTNRYFLDANCLLNAAFVPTSWANEVTRRISERGGSLLTDYAVVDEAMRSAVKIALVTLPPRSVFWFLMGFLKYAQIHVLPAVASSPGAPHDSHVENGALAADAILLTSDIPLRARCEAKGIRALTLYEALVREKGLGVHTCFLGVVPSGENGTVFLRCLPCPNVPGYFCLIELEGFFKVLYDNEKGEWVLVTNEVVLKGPKVSYHPHASIALAIDWDDQEIRVRASGVDHPKLHPRPKWSSPVPRSTFIGHDSTGKGHWSSAIRYAVWDDRRLGDAWKLCREFHFATPNPFDHDRLRDAVRARLSI